MKLLTLNTYSLIQPNYETKLVQFANVIADIQPDIIALQEVNQTLTAPPATVEELRGYIPCGTEIIRNDNHALRVSKLLQDRGVFMEWTWSAAKIGYSKYEEGLAMFSRTPIQKAKAWYITRSQDVSNWHTRKVLSIEGVLDNCAAQFVNVHLGWWKDKDEPFQEQWTRLQDGLAPSLPHILLGDFNNSATVSNEGYDYIIKQGWQDTWRMATEQLGEATIPDAIDGWRDVPNPGPSRIDYIFCDCPLSVICSKVLFDGKTAPVVSDHFGVLVVADWGKN